MNSRDYWEKRARQREERAANSTRRLAGRLKREYARAERAIEAELAAFYARYADKAGLDYAEVRKRLNPKELTSYREQTQLYYDEVKRLGLEDEDVLAYLRELSAKSYVSRLDALRAAIRQELFLLAAAEKAELDGALPDQYETERLRGAFDLQQFQGFGDAFIHVDRDAARRAVTEPWLGANYSARVWKRRRELENLLNLAIPQATILGKGPRELAKTISKRLGVSYGAAMRLARTELMRAANDGAASAWEELGIDSYQYIATLSALTCEVCGALDLKVFKHSDRQTGVNHPPMHPNCKCTTRAHFPELDGAGDRLSYLPDKGPRKTDQWFSVPADMTFEQWREKYVHLPEKRAKIDQKGSGGKPDVRVIGKIDRDIYSVVTKDITTDEVVMTDERIAHIEEGHPGAYQMYGKYIPEMLADPDYLVEANRPNTAVLLKEMKAEGERFKLILRLQTYSDPAGYSNSVITFMKTHHSEWNRLLNNKRVLYKKQT